MDELDFSAIGSRIRKQREFLGYTRDYLAEQLSVSTNFCRDIEIGAKGMSIQTLVKLSKILKLSVDYILLGKTADNGDEPLLVMLNSCRPDKRKYAEDILKSFLLAVE
ncbi:MAG: helix-turn-helix transcriptional regulator [Prevotellaceae bacterium]|jgi:transcriptional regulator with XRE-family HTH domain|nr:helix-turn-helix transcriptional regulator [Prevotellaceae bacterium]